MKHRTVLLAASAAIALLLPGAPPWAQAYPSKTVKIVAPVQPGGGVDLTARTVAEQLTKSMGQPFVVENVPAAAA
jgi:tripartite-type tricarboxylate transporter receptor subunit TctC